MIFLQPLLDLGPDIVIECEVFGFRKSYVLFSINNDKNEKKKKLRNFSYGPKVVFKRRRLLTSDSNL